MFKNVSIKQDDNSAWYLTNEYPFYFIKENSENDYEAISLFFADDNVVVEHNNIKYSDIPKNKIKEVKSEIFAEASDMYVRFSVVESAITDGLGERLFIDTFQKTMDDIEEVNLFLYKLGIDVSVESRDFEC